MARGTMAVNICRYSDCILCLITLSLSEDVPKRVLKLVQDGFMKCVIAKAIAHEAVDKEIIPENVESDIVNAKDDRSANHYMFRHLSSQATVEDLRKLCNIMKDAKGYRIMNGFGEKLEAELDKVSM